MDFLRFRQLPKQQRKQNKKGFWERVIIYPIIFSGSSFGFRPKHSLNLAFKTIKE